MAAGLTTKVEFVEEFAILLDVTLADVVEHSTSPPDQQHETTTTVVVFFMSLQVLRQGIDSFRQQCDLHFWRTRVSCMLTVLRNDVFGPQFGGSRHVRTLPLSASRFAGVRMNRLFAGRPGTIPRHHVRARAQTDSFMLRRTHRVSTRTLFASPPA